MNALLGKYNFKSKNYLLQKNEIRVGKEIYADKCVCLKNTKRSLKVENQRDAPPPPPPGEV
jgi:hypothetical protein